MLVFCALSIAYKAVEDQNVGNGFGKRWYSIVIFAYDFLVRYSRFNLFSLWALFSSCVSTTIKLSD